MAVKAIVPATSLQKKNFTTQFAEIVKSNDQLRDKYKIVFFDSTSKTNYVFNGLDGKSINVLQLMTMEEADEYKKLKSHWQR
jgi:hypothetical protein